MKRKVLIVLISLLLFSPLSFSTFGDSYACETSLSFLGFEEGKIKEWDSTIMEVKVKNLDPVLCSVSVRGEASGSSIDGTSILLGGLEEKIVKLRLKTGSYSEDEPYDTAIIKACSSSIAKGSVCSELQVGFQVEVEKTSNCILSFLILASLFVAFYRQ